MAGNFEAIAQFHKNSVVVIRFERYVQERGIKPLNGSAGRKITGMSLGFGDWSRVIGGERAHEFPHWAMLSSAEKHLDHQFDN